MKITGLDELTRELKDAEKALEGLDGELGSVSYVPHDPGSIELAIARMEAMVDERIGDFSFNPIITPLVESMKEQYRHAILEQAASARLIRGNE